MLDSYFLLHPLEDLFSYNYWKIFHRDSESFKRIKFAVIERN